jgi:DNA-binding NarL/FixJ family response regulator
VKKNLSFPGKDLFLIMVTALLVEDNVAFRESLKETLHSRFPAMGVMEAGDGEQALQKIEALPPDLVFMDIKLPGENGLSLTKKIKAAYPNVVVVILTSYDLPEYREAAFQYHANYFIAKASVSTKIVEVVESILSGLEEKNV